jgi:hypothetical protein
VRNNKKGLELEPQGGRGKKYSEEKPGIQGKEGEDMRKERGRTMRKTGET